MRRIEARRRKRAPKAVRTGASNRKRNVTPRPDSLLDIGVSPTLAGFAPAMPDRSPPLATKESDSASLNESAWRHSCEGGPTVGRAVEKSVGAHRAVQRAAARTADGGDLELSLVDVFQKLVKHTPGKSGV